MASSYCCRKVARRFYRANRPQLPCTTHPNYRESLDIVNPATKQKIGEVREDNLPDVNRKLEYLQAGQKKWKATTMSQRKTALLNFADALTIKKNTLARILTSETGKPVSQARSEISATVDRINFFIENCDKVLEDITVHETSRLKEKVVYEPLGVVGNISAWNYPYFLSTNVFAAALLTGNTVLYKPSEHATLTGQEITDMLHQSGVPEDAFVMSTGGPNTGSRVAGLSGLSALFFTGSYNTGVSIAKKASPHLVKLQLELGGKDAAYIRHDVPNLIGAATTVADGAFYNSGQSCCSVKRIYVDKRIFIMFVEAFKKVAQNYKVGDPLQEDTYIGPLCTQQQLVEIKAQLTDAMAKGAKMHVGGNTARSEAHTVGYYFPPSTLTDVSHSMMIMRHETFAPIVGIQCVDGDEEAIEFMRDTNYGLSASVFCKHKEDAEAILSELNVGTGYWNCCDRVSPRLPWSGRKHSGMGSTLGMDGLRAFVQPKGLFLQQPIE